MKDNLIFYSVYEDKIYILAGQIGTARSKYTFPDYPYQNPIDDSSVVDLYYKELGNLLIDIQNLLSIIKKTKFPNFVKNETDGLTYIIKVDYIDNDQLANLLNQYQLSYLRLNHGASLRWRSLKWFPLDQFEMLVNGYVVSKSFVFG